MEKWKNIDDTNGYYLVSNKGRVKSLKSNALEGGVILKLQTCKKGYQRVGLSINKKPKLYSVHRLVAIAFVKNHNNKEQVNHIDGVKTNNNVENLEWCTNQENMNHAIGVLNTYEKNQVKGEAVNFAVLTEEQVKLIPEYLLTKTAKQISIELGVGHTTITEIVAGRSWAHLKLKFPLLKDKKRNGNAPYPHIYQEKKGTFKWEISKQVNNKRKFYSKCGFSTAEEALTHLNINRPV